MPTDLYLEIVTAERLVYSGPVRLVSAPAAEGRLGILPGHAPLLASLQPGELRLQPVDEDEEISLAIGGGFLEVSRNRVIVLAHSAERAAEIDLERAVQARERAQARLRDRDEAAAERAREAVARAEARIKVAEGYRRTQGS